MTDKRDAAVALANAGFRVFPCTVNGKTPVVANFPNVASSDPAKVLEMWSEAVTGEPRHNNIGISTDDLLVLDFDVKGGAPGIADFECRNATLAFRHIVMTPSGGCHAYLRLPEGVRCASSTKKLGAGTDVRSYHGYVLGPGSEINGVAYEWVGPAVTFTDLAEAPQRLIDECGAPKEREPLNIDGVEWDTPAAMAAATNYLKTAAPIAISDQGGNDTAYKVAAHVRGLAVSEGQCLDLLFDHWNERCEPPWSAEELQKIVGNAYQYAKGAPHEPGSEFTPVVLRLVPTPRSSAGDSAPLNSKKKITRESAREAAETAVTQKTIPLVDKLLDCDSISMIYGAPGAGKSFIALELARCVAMGAPFAGRTTTKGAVVYFGLEGTAGLRKRIKAILMHKADNADIPLHLVSGRLNLFKNTEDDEALIIEEIRAVERETGLPVLLVVIDTLARIAAGADENGVKDMGPVMERAETIKNAVRAHVAIVHHAGKDASRGLRGSSALLAAPDTVILLAADKYTPGTPQTGTLKVEKQKDEEMIFDIKFRLDRKDLWTDPETLQPTSSCIVEFPPASRVTKEARGLSPAATAFGLLERTSIEDGASSPWPSIKKEVARICDMTPAKLEKWVSSQPSGRLPAGDGHEIEIKRRPGRRGNLVKIWRNEGAAGSNVVPLRKTEMNAETNPESSNPEIKKTG